MTPFIGNKKVNEFVNLLNLGINKLLKPIPIPTCKEEMRKKIDPSINPAILTTQSYKSLGKVAEEKIDNNNTPIQKSQMVISLCNQVISRNFEFAFSFINNLSSNKDTFITDCNKFPIIHYNAESGNSVSSVIYELIEYIKFCYETDSNFSKKLNEYGSKSLKTLGNTKWENLSEFDKAVILGVCNSIGGWTSTMKVGSQVIIKDMENNNITNENINVIIQGGNSAGKKNCKIIARNDNGLTAQHLTLQQLELKQENCCNEQQQQQQQNIPNLNELLQAIKSCHEQYLKINKNSPSTQILLVLRSILQISAITDWNQAVQQGLIEKKDSLKLIEILCKLCSKCPVDCGMNFYQNTFTEAWERLLDTQESNFYLFTVPQLSEIDLNSDYGAIIKDFAQIDLKKLELSKKKSGSLTLKSTNSTTTNNEIINNNGSILNLSEFILPDSSYLTAFPEVQMQLGDHKMLLYWEKHIIPRIQDFVRGSLKTWEFDDFFEQIRQPLRKGEQSGALAVAYIICENKLPAGVILPDANHDWTTFSIEEIFVGQWAIAKILNKAGMLNSPFFNHQKKLGNLEVCVQVISVDVKSATVLVLYHDYENLQLLSIWLPITCLKPVENPLTPHANSFPKEKILVNFLSQIENIIALNARQTLLKFFSINAQSTAVQLKKEEILFRDFKLPVIEIIKWSVLDELSDDPIEGWLKFNGESISVDSSFAASAGKLRLLHNHNKKKFLEEVFHLKKDKKNLKLKGIQIFLNWLSNNADNSDSSSTLNSIISWIKTTFSSNIDFISSSVNRLDLHKQSLENNNKPFALSHFESSIDPISALCITFKDNATLCHCSGLKFFSDPDGINLIQVIQASKEKLRTKLAPILFKMSNVWCNYYFNAEILPPLLQDQSATTLPALVYGIPSGWSVCCWIIDSLTSSLMLSNNGFY